MYVQLRRGKALIQQSNNLHVVNVAEYVSTIQASVIRVILINLPQIIISTMLEITYRVCQKLAARVLVSPVI